mmetsp:Transcript_9717/g.27786  ORF Transcript_9717/g.27786 Transcript_9717/m.27786 type:complete len:210 (+) Transcript_9717:402-1031(+)
MCFGSCSSSSSGLEWVALACFHSYMGTLTRFCMALIRWETCADRPAIPGTAPKGPTYPTAQSCTTWIRLSCGIRSTCHGQRPSAWKSAPRRAPTATRCPTSPKRATTPRNSGARTISVQSMTSTASCLASPTQRTLSTLASWRTRPRLIARWTQKSSGISVALLVIPCQLRLLPAQICLLLHADSSTRQHPRSACLAHATLYLQKQCRT